MHNFAAPYPAMPGKVTKMTKTSTKARSKTAIVAGVAIKPRRVRKVATVVAEDPVAPAVEATQAPVVTEAPKAEAQVFAIPDLGFADLKVSREGHFQIAPKAYKPLVQEYGKDAVRAAVQAMVVLKGANISLEKALLLATWPSFRPHMLQQLATVYGHKDREGALGVLSWIWANQGWSFTELYEEFPRMGRPGLKVGKEKIGKANALLTLLDGLRTDKRTSAKGLDFLAQACQLLGWF